MTQTGQDIALAVAAAQRDSEAADAFVRQYMGFIRSETVKFIHTAPENGHEDELSIAMLAFYEAILGYQKTKGPFLAYAARSIRNRLIDHYRREKRRGNTISLYTPDAEDRELADTLREEKDQLEAHVLRQASREEIREFGEKLAAFGLSFSDVTDNCPRQRRTFLACRRALDYARANPALLRQLEQTGRLAINELAAGSQTEKKTLERHRKYLVAILLAFTNGYEIIRGHLCQIGPGKGGKTA